MAEILRRLRISSIKRDVCAGVLISALLTLKTRTEHPHVVCLVLESLTCEGGNMNNAMLVVAGLLLAMADAAQVDGIGSSFASSLSDEVDGVFKDLDGVFENLQSDFGASYSTDNGYTGGWPNTVDLSRGYQSERIGNLVHMRGIALNGQSWSAMTTDLGNGTTVTNVVDSNGQTSSRTCYQSHCY
jgi:hypothetical protein